MELWAFAFDSDADFSFNRCLFRYGDREFLLISGDQNDCHIVQTIIDDREELEETFQNISNFLHGFGWVNRCSFIFSGSMAMGRKGKGDLWREIRRLHVKRKCKDYELKDFIYYRNLISDEQKIALSLMNDANNSRDPFLRFLIYWKVLGIRYSDRNTSNAEEWVNIVVSGDHNVYIGSYLEDLMERGVDVGKHFKEQFRNAIAHIERKPTLIAYKFEDIKRVNGACNSLVYLVHYFIRNELSFSKYDDKIEVLKEE